MDFHEALVGKRWLVFRLVDHTALMRESLARRKWAADNGVEPEVWTLYPTEQAAFDWWMLTGERLPGVEVTATDKEAET